MKLAIGRLRAEREADDPEAHVIRSGEVVVDEATYTAKLGRRVLDLTFKEFELLKYLAQHPGRVFSRQQLLQEVWGYDYFGGTRTVDVHVRRLRAKLGPEHETLIGTVRNVGYRFVLPAQEQVRGTRPRLPGRLRVVRRRLGRRGRRPPQADRGRRRATRRRPTGPRRSTRRPGWRCATAPTTSTSWVNDDGFALVIGDDLSLAVRPRARGRGVGELAAGRGAGGVRRRAAGVVARRPPGGGPAGGAARVRPGPRAVGDAAAGRRPVGQIAVPEGVVIRGYRPGDERRAAARQRRGVRAPPRAGRDVGERPGRADGRAVVRPRRAAGRDRRRPDARLPLDQAALARPRRGLRRRRRPRTRRASASASALTRAGLDHLAGRGVSEVELYVEADNAAAIALYTRPRLHPRTQRDTHVMYRRG